MQAIRKSVASGGGVATKTTSARVKEIIRSVFRFAYKGVRKNENKKGERKSKKKKKMKKKNAFPSGAVSSSCHVIPPPSFLNVIRIILDVCTLRIDCYVTVGTYCIRCAQYIPRVLIGDFRPTFARLAGEARPTPSSGTCVVLQSMTAVRLRYISGWSVPINSLVINERRASHLAATAPCRSFIHDRRNE